MDKFVIDTNFFITGFQSQPNTFALFAQICSDLQCKIFIPHLIKNEMRYFLQREVLPYVELVKIDNEAFQHFLRKVYSLTANLPQKPDLSVIFLAHEEDATIVSSDLKLLEVAELLDIKTLTNSAFVRYLLTENRDDTHKQFLQNLEKRLFGEEIRYSVSSTNRYDPVKRIRKIFESALSVVREEYEERIDAQSDIPERDEFSIYALQLKELLEEVQKDLHSLAYDFEEERFSVLESELISRDKEITDFIVDWKLAIDDIEDHIIYNKALEILGKIQYLLCICLIENKKLDLARVYMDKLMLLLFQNTDANEQYGMDVHVLRMIILLLSGQYDRLSSYFIPAFEDKCRESNRPDIANLIHALILLSVILSRSSVEETAQIVEYESIEFINQLGFKFMTLNKIKKAELMFTQTFYLALNNNQKGLCIASLEYLTWIYFTGRTKTRSCIENLYSALIKKFPDIKSSYSPNLKLLKTTQHLTQFSTNGQFLPIKQLDQAFRATYYYLDESYIKLNRKKVTLIRLMNWDLQVRIGLIDENNEYTHRMDFGTILNLVDGKFAVEIASNYIQRKYGVELLLKIDYTSRPVIAIKSTSGWEIDYFFQEGE
ncbi:MAG: hypothetical protein ACTSYD_01645 [Candidatus Heimdallarchaeaceae archaeon]